MKYWKSEQFLELQEKWYKKLKSKGFLDIEYKVPQGCLAGINGTLLVRKSALERENIAEYYSQLTHWAYNYLPKRSKARRACLLHVEGHTYREIAAMLGISKSQVWRMVQYECRRMSDTYREEMTVSLDAPLDES